jgi:hypothetical protein
MPIAVALFFLRYSGRLPFRSIVPLLSSLCVCRFFLSGPILQVARPTLVLVHLFLTMFLLCHATIAPRDTVLHMAANFFQDPQSPRVSTYGFPLHPAARYWPLCRLFSALLVSTAARSFGTSDVLPQTPLPPRLAPCTLMCLCHF